VSDQVVEALLEMHYHSAIVQMFAQTFGANFLRMLKPSTQQEAWVGFDQGWVKAPALDQQDLYDSLGQEIQTGGNTVQGFYLGYFLQFKALREMAKRSKYAPTYSAPYLRSELSLRPNDSTGLSQHETLLRLSQVQGALVYYACPRLFDLDQIYDSPDLDTVEIVDVQAAPVGWQPSERHFLAFRKSTPSAPQWLSDPVEAKSFSCAQWTRNPNLSPPRKTGAQIRALIQDCTSALGSRDVGQHVWTIPQSFTILEFAGI
jgi:hypothetical protein